MDKTKAELKDLMETYELTNVYVAKATGLSTTTVSMWINGTYKGDNTKVTEKIKNFIKRENARYANWSIPIVEISIMEMVKEIARLCHTCGRIGVCVGVAGLGKTVAAKDYVSRYMDAILIESDYSYTARSLLLELHHKLGLSCKGSAYNLMNEVVDKLKNSGRLIIIDEAENLRREALEMTRRIHDKTGVGLLLIGREVLLNNLRGHENQFDQMYSRVMYKKNLENLVLNDIQMLLKSAGQKIDLAKTYLVSCRGNTRRLEHLICNSINVAELNGSNEVDEAIVKETSKMLMDKED